MKVSRQVAEQFPHRKDDPPDPGRWGRSPTWARPAGEPAASAAGWGADPTWENAGPGRRVVDDPSSLAALGSDSLRGAARPPSRRRRLGVRRLALVGGAGLLATAALAVAVIRVADLPGDAGPRASAIVVDRPPVSLAPALTLIASPGGGWSDYVSARNAAEVARKRAVAKERRARELQRVSRAKRRRAEALAANQVVSAPAATPATPVPSAPATPADPWAGISPMVRQTTPGPWNNGGSS